MKVVLFGATGKTGRYVVAELLQRRHEVTAVGRNEGRLAVLPAGARRAVADLARPETLPAAMVGAEVVASLAHARHTVSLLAALPASCRRVVLTGSLRKYSRLPDPAAAAVREAEAQFHASGIPGVMLHPSMIYGAPDDRNVNRILRFLGRWPAFLPLPVPLPDGGAHSLQPVFVDDMVAAFVAAIENASADGPPIAVAGPAPITYRELVETCAAALGRRVVVVSVPTALLVRLARFGGRLGVGGPFNAAELARAAEDKAFDVTPLRDRLSVTPRPFAEGLRLKLARRWT